MFKFLVVVMGLLAMAYQSHAAEDALDEVNQYRASMGLQPFQRDDGLSQAAAACAEYRAKWLIKGHTDSDFNFLPAGVSADASGCGALSPDWGWGSCCSRENWRYAGAARVLGRDGRRYMQLFVRQAPPYTWTRPQISPVGFTGREISRLELCGMASSFTG